MQECTLTNELRTYGPDCVRGRLRFAPNGSTLQTIAEGAGVVSVTRNGAGDWTIQLPGGLVDIIADAGFINGSDSNFHEVSVFDVNQTARTIRVKHRTCTYATIVSAGPSASDSIDRITVTFDARKG